MRNVTGAVDSLTISEYLRGIESSRWQCLQVKLGALISSGAIRESHSGQRNFFETIKLHPGSMWSPDNRAAMRPSLNDFGKTGDGRDVHKFPFVETFGNTLPVPRAMVTNLDAPT